MNLPTLYARTNTGAVQEWTVDIDGDSYRTIHGQVGGKLQTTEWTVCIPTNEGRSNERNAAQQAIFEAQAMWQKKVDSGYFEDVCDIDNDTFVEPMLAKKWEDRKTKVKFPLFCQPKLDGLRAVISKKGAFTRNGKQWVAIPHILKELQPLFDEFPNLVIDGELYNHDLHDDFNKITSLVKKTKPSQADLDECAKIVEFHWYDVCDNTRNFFGRQRFMRFNYRKNFTNGPTKIKLVPTYEVANQKDMDALYGLFLDDGYEGQMVRENTNYEFKRSNSLMKRKEFQDAEYRVRLIIEGAGNLTGCAAAIEFENELGYTFNSNIKGSKEYKKYILDHPDEFIDKLATVRFFNLTPEKLIPRFPYVYGFPPDKD